MTFLKLPFWDYFKTYETYPQNFNNVHYWTYISAYTIFFAGLLFFLFVLCNLVFMAINHMTSKTKIIQGKLIDKKYTKLYDGYMFYIQADKVYSVEVGMQNFYKSDIGEIMIVELTTGGLSKKEICIELMG